MVVGNVFVGSVLSKCIQTFTHTFKLTVTAPDSINNDDYDYAPRIIPQNMEGTSGSPGYSDLNPASKDAQVFAIGCNNCYRYSFDPINITGYNYIEFDLWLPKGFNSTKEVLYPNQTPENLEPYTQGQIELSSGGTHDSLGEIQWNIETALVPKVIDEDGVVHDEGTVSSGAWYKVILRLPKTVSEDLNITKINFFGFYWSDAVLDEYLKSQQYGYDRIGWGAIRNLRFTKYGTYDAGCYRTDDNNGGVDPTIYTHNGQHYYRLGNNVYQTMNTNTIDAKPANNASVVIAGNDKIPNTEDDNRLSGRTTSDTHNGSTPPAIINFSPSDMSYQISGAHSSYKVKRGLDGLFGTWDDLIVNNLEGAPLGSYPVTGQTSRTLIGWQYMGGSVNNMLMICQYVLDPTAYHNESVTAQTYSGSTLQTTIDGAIRTELGIWHNIFVASNPKCSTPGGVVNGSVRTCNVAHMHGNGCVHALGTYNVWTDNIYPTGQYLFACNAEYIAKCFGSGLYREERLAQQLDTSFSYSSEGTMKNGYGNIIETAGYWLSDSLQDSYNSGGWLFAAVLADETIDNRGLIFAMNFRHYNYGIRPAGFFNLQANPS